MLFRSYLVQSTRTDLEIAATMSLRCGKVCGASYMDSKRLRMNMSLGAGVGAYTPMQAYSGLPAQD